MIACLRTKIAITLSSFQRFDPLVFVLLRQLPKIKRLLHAQPDLRPIALFGITLVGAGASLEFSELIGTKDSIQKVEDALDFFSVLGLYALGFPSSEEALKAFVLEALD